MQKKAEIEPYFAADLNLIRRPHLQFNRMLFGDVPKRFVAGKLLSNYLLQGLSELHKIDNASALVLAQTQPEDDLLLQRFWPLDSVIKIYPCSYNLFIDQTFKATAENQVISFVSSQESYDDPFWKQADQQIILNLEQFLRKLSQQSSSSLLSSGFSPVLVEEVIGKTRILNQHDWYVKAWQKQCAGYSKKKKEKAPARPQAGWSTGVMSLQRDVAQSGWRYSIARYEFSQATSPMEFIEAAISAFDARLKQLNLSDVKLDELLISATSLQAAQLLSEACAPLPSTSVLLPDHIFGWNPIGSCLRVLATQLKLCVGILIDKAPFVDIVVAYDAR